MLLVDDVCQVAAVDLGASAGRGVGVGGSALRASNWGTGFVEVGAGQERVVRCSAPGLSRPSSPSPRRPTSGPPPGRDQSVASHFRLCVFGGAVVSSVSFIALLCIIIVVIQPSRRRRRGARLPPRNNTLNVDLQDHRHRHPLLPLTDNLADGRTPVPRAWRWWWWWRCDERDVVHVSWPVIPRYSLLSRRDPRSLARSLSLTNDGDL